MGGSTRAESEDRLSNFINGKQNKNTTVVFFRNSQKHSNFESDAAHPRNAKV